MNKLPAQNTRWAAAGTVVFGDVEPVSGSSADCYAVIKGSAAAPCSIDAGLASRTFERRECWREVASGVRPKVVGNKISLTSGGGRHATSQVIAAEDSLTCTFNTTGGNR